MGLIEKGRPFLSILLIKEEQLCETTLVRAFSITPSLAPLSLFLVSPNLHILRLSIKRRVAYRIVAHISVYPYFE